MSLTLLTPISSGKMYCFDEYVRGVLRQDIERSDLFWLFIVQEQLLTDRHLDRLHDLQRRLDGQFAGIELLFYQHPVGDQFFDPRREALTWKERAKFAGDMRAVGIDFVRSDLPECDTILSLGCDVCLQAPDDLTRMLAPNPDGFLPPLLSGVINARVRGFPLVLHYDPAKRHLGPEHLVEPWIDYPRDRRFVAGWTGMDILTIRRPVFEGISLWDFTIQEFGTGEDGWYCRKSLEALGVETWVDPFVAPYHIHESGRVLWPGGEVPARGILSRCDACGIEDVLLKSYSDRGGECHRCKSFRYSDPWWADQRFCPPPYTIRGGV